MNCTKLYYTKLWWTQMYSYKLHCTKKYCIKLYNNQVSCTKFHYTALQCNALYCNALPCAKLHCTALYLTAVHCTELNCTSLNSTILHYTILSCPERHYIFLHFVYFLGARNMPRCEEILCGFSNRKQLEKSCKIPCIFRGPYNNKLYLVAKLWEKKKKSRIRETKHLSTDADSSTDTTVGWTKKTKKPKKI